MNWNFKMWGAVFLAIVILSASGLILSQQPSEGESVSIISRVNNDGSGIFVRNTVAGDFVTIDGETITYYPSDWGGKLFMTPGPASIQHMMLTEIVKEKVGLKFDLAPDNNEFSSDTVYWIGVPPGQMKDVMGKNSNIDGGIAWEPHYAVAIASGNCRSILKTSEYWEGKSKEKERQRDEK